MVRIILYTIIGFIFGFIGPLVAFRISSDEIFPFGFYGLILFGLISGILGAILGYRLNKKKSLFNLKSDDGESAN